MNILKNVMNKLSQEEKKEVNLASEKINLGLVEDMKALYNASKLFNEQSKKNITEAGIINKNALQVVSKQEEIDKKADDLESKAERLYKEFEKAAKDLGLNPKNSDAFKLYNDILKELVSKSDAKGVKSVVTMRL